MKTDLKIDWATHEAAKFAVENWHYSKCMPSFKTVKIGAWERGRFVGAVIFSMGAAPQAHRPYKILPREICELTRVAFRNHETTVSRIVSICLRFLKSQSPGLRLIVSYADPEQGHHGGIYQAGGWVYQGLTKPCEQFEFISTGKRVHTKTIRTGRRGLATELKQKGVIRAVRLIKHKYLMPLDPEMRKQILPLSKPYPKRATTPAVDFATTNKIASLGAGTHHGKPKRAASETVDTPPDQGGKGGSIPTAALHS